MRSRSAFTLIELLVVMSLIGILVAITTISFDNARQKGRDGARKQDLQAIKTALVLYYQDFRQFPPSCQGPSCKAESFTSSAGANWIPELEDYIKESPKDPRQASSRLELVKSVYAQAEDSKTTLPVAQGFYNRGLWGANPPVGGQGHYQNIDDPIGSPDEDATTIQIVCTEVPDCIGLDVKDSWLFADPLIPPQTTQINKVRVWIRARLGPSGSAGLRPFLRINSKDYELGVPSLSLNYQWYSFDSTTNPSTVVNPDNPNTGNPWQLSEVKNLEAGVRLNGSPAVLYVTAVYIEVFYPAAIVPPPPPPPPPPPTPPPVGGDCSGAAPHTYCYAVSLDHQAFVLWAQLENSKNQEIFNKPDATCSLTPPNTFLNYCLQSPQ